ncbi:ankyrin [Thozetella sp. PMI_491]|nr:ankyrin [Thozetella sp. PMI_491]
MSTHFVGVNTSAHCQAVLELMPSPMRKVADNADLYSLLKRFRAAEATNPIDRIFALLGLCSKSAGHGQLRPDYSKSIGDIIRAVISHICFCDIDSVPEKLCSYNTIDGFLSELETLDTRLLEHLVESSDYPSIQKFLPQRKQNIQNFAITEKTLLGIAKSTDFGIDLMRTMVQICREQIIFTEEVVVALAENRATGLDILREISPKPDQELKIQGEKATRLWMSDPHGKEIMKLLYGIVKVQLQFEDDEFDRIRTNGSDSEVLLALLANTPNLDTSVNDHNEVFETALDAGYVLLVASSKKPGDADDSADQNLVHNPPSDSVAIKLARAILDKDETAIATLANEHQVPNLHNDIERLPSLHAAETGDINLLTELVDNGAYMEYQNEWGESLLAVASRGGHTVVVDYLAQKGVLLDSKSLFGWTPLHLAAGQGHIDVVRLLIKYGTAVDSRSIFGWTPSMAAVVGGSASIFGVLVENGADIDAQDEDGDTLLLLAV